MAAPSPTRVASRHLFAEGEIERNVLEEVRRVMGRAFPGMKALYRRVYNSQKVHGKVFEDLVGAVVNGYDPNTGGWGSWLSPDYQPYVGRADFPPDHLPQVKEMVRRAILVVLGEFYGEALGVSNNYRWDLDTEEHFWFLGMGFDVREAKRTLTKRPRVVESLPLEGIGSLASRVLGENPDSNSVDVRLPVLVATTPRGNLLPIDGWNRIRKALGQGLETVPAVVLNASETRKILL